MPRHINPTSLQRTATAPYNFVPLPERIFTVADGIEVNGERIKPWEMHDRFAPGTYTGWIDLAIETLTPLYIRGAVSSDGEGNWDGRDARLRPEPYMRPDGTPAIPGSSLRGMVRNLVEILAFGKIQPVSQARPFFRDISPSRISTEYRRHFIEDLGDLSSGVDVATGQPVSQRAPAYRARVRAGLLNLSDRAIRECPIARVDQALISGTFTGTLLSGSGPMATPNWGLQHSEIWVQADRNERDYFFCRKITRNGRQRHPDLYLRFRKVHAASQAEMSGYQRGVLAITGSIPNKHLEFVLLDAPGGATPTIRIPDGVWERFHDEDQITQWQEKAFPTNRPTNHCRKAKGHLRDGEPVFFLSDHKGDLVFLGRAQMFRFAYDLSPEDLLPGAVCSADLDLAEAMFGKVDQQTTIKGRVQFEDAVATSGGPEWCEPILVPQILSSPKPTTFQHYLTQDGTREKDQLTTYLDGDHTAIRGHKLYWHRWEEGSGISQVKETNDHASLLQDLRRPSPNDTQHTLMEPVKAGVTFSGRVRFENLTDLELGALLEALQLPEGCCHRIGMGKPLGLGSVQITSRLQLVDRAARYRAWQASGVQENEDGSGLGSAFVATMLQHARASGETLLSNRLGLRQIGRLDALYQILTWTDRPAPQSTGYMDLQRFRERPVLPTPHAVTGDVEPPWPDDPPRTGSSHGGQEGPRDAVREVARDSRPLAAPRPAPSVKPVEKGQTRSGVLQRRNDEWVALFEGESREGQIINSNQIPDACTEGSAAEFYIAQQSKRGGIKARFERLKK